MGLLLEKTERTGVISSQRERWKALLREPWLVPGRCGDSPEPISVLPTPAPGTETCVPCEGYEAGTMEVEARRVEMPPRRAS